ncbi:protein of unknown function [Candidatus Nitrosocosmicus franklandus]|uniref:Uncharacterized protein n=1 Tax=Candidatus Nitrosocosmicus franklandianus TaxID=1798806 RepID=A0A484IFA4_9ARCH|nr:protein of unknown function [Candidatus Nitrosocosmicus franklandus]
MKKITISNSRNRKNNYIKRPQFFGHTLEFSNNNNNHKRKPLHFESVSDLQLPTQYVRIQDYCCLSTRELFSNDRSIIIRFNLYLIM